MKRILTILFIALLCNTCYSQNKIELNLTKGKVYNQKMSMVMAIKQAVNNMDVNINMTINGSTAFTVTDYKAGVYDINVAYTALSVKTDMQGGQSISFDSEKADEKDVVSTSLGLMKNKPFHMKMNRQGKVLEITNVNQLFTSVFEKFSHLAPEEKQKLQGQIEQSFGEKAFRNNMENMMSFYPQKPVGKGSTWTMKNNIVSANVEMQMENNYKLDEVTATQYLISGISKMSSPNTDTYVEVNGMSAKTAITGDVTANMKIDKKTGWIDEAISSMSLKGSVSIKGNDKLPDGITIPMEISGKATISAN
ncbi:MAG TPA: DUF6263 family protein [Pedobacter sp.]|uniref:DUF6263 family protein n=1 Tax=Pedobacter sp. TaxID=1411316 RepID=UPI002B68AA7A|nr:DUF6263 family protein [Pedobacter sp.]HMI05038.1 DUF6263 family protein [Pedobacter sp.]